MKEFIKQIENVNDLEQDTLKMMFKNIATSTGVKGKNLYMPIRLLLTGQMHGAEIVNIIKLLGKEEVLKRVSK